MPPAVKAHLAALGIQVAAETPAHYLLTRDNLIALLEHTTLIAGSTGMLTDQGLAYLIWHDSQPYLKSKSAEIAATEEQVTAIRQFSRDLQSALRQGPDMLT